MKNKYTHSAWLAGLLIILSSLVTGCSDSSEPDVQQGRPLQVNMTRSDSEEETPVQIGTQICLWLVQSDDTKQSGYVTYAGKDANKKDVWNSGVFVEGSKTYYIYGYMPSKLVDGSDITATKDGNVVTGATLKLEGLKVLSKEDFSIVIGVKAGEDDIVRRGDFSYTAEAENNGITLLVDHLYAGASFKMNINAEYNKLRTIKLKKMELVCTDPQMRSKVNATITFRNGLTNPVNSITTNRDADADEAKQTLFEDAEGIELTEAESVIDAMNFLPTFASSLALFSTYDVYDKKGNLIRENCTATNKLTGILSGIQRGQIRPVLLTVNPTYIYVLSEPDLDKPDLVIGN